MRRFATPPRASKTDRVIFPLPRERGAIKPGNNTPAHLSSRRVAKPSLMSTLAKVSLGSVVSLVAPAGYGKSAVLHFRAWPAHA